MIKFRTHPCPADSFLIVALNDPHKVVTRRFESLQQKSFDQVVDLSVCLIDGKTFGRRPLGGVTAA